MTLAKYKVIGSSTTTSVDNKTRKEILLKLPQYSQSFNISTLLDNERMRAVLHGQSYRIVLQNGVIQQQGTITEKTDIVRTDASVKVRCEIGVGKWEIQEDAYDNSHASVTDDQRESI